jgi:hypothetical protein
MKTAISLPDELFSSADALAQRLGVRRHGGLPPLTCLLADGGEDRIGGGRAF